MVERLSCEFIAEEHERPFALFAEFINPHDCYYVPGRMYHTFWAEDTPCIIGEVSKTNNDITDNRFYKEVGRFPEIEEDETPLYLLCTEY